MSKNITVWSKNSIEYQKLNIFKSFLDIIIIQNNLPITISIENTYFDVGQNWMWTTIIVNKINCSSCLNSYQLLNPADHERIVFGDLQDIVEICLKFKTKFLKLYNITQI